MYRLIIEPKDRYGLQIGGICVYDITPKRCEAESLLLLCQNAQISQLHAYDVVEDWFGKIAYESIENCLLI